jgi:predicted secreted protein
MFKELGRCGDSATITMQTQGKTTPDNIGVEGTYHIVCHDKNGNLKWEEGFPNLVVNAGKQLMLDTLLRTSGTYTTVGPFLGLTNVSITPALTDTMTTLVGGSKEFVNYSTTGGAGIRGTAVFAAAASTANVSSANATAITYTITGTGGNIFGCFLVTGTSASNATGSTAGTLYSEGNFATSKSTSAGDTVSVTYSTTATSG